MKKNIKKMAAVAMAASMIMSMSCINVMAADITDTNSGETEVKYSVTQTYTWSVPTEIKFTADNATITADGDSGTTQKVKVTKNVIPDGKKLQITAKGSGDNNAFEIKTSAGNKLSYAIYKGTKADANKVAVDGTVLSVDAGTNEGSVALVFDLTKEKTEKAGDYTGTVTYTASIN